MKRGEEEKKFVWPGYLEDIYTKELDWCQSEYGWTEEEFEQYGMITVRTARYGAIYI